MTTDKHEAIMRCRDRIAGELEEVNHQINVDNGKNLSRLRYQRQIYLSLMNYIEEELDEDSYYKND